MTHPTDDELEAMAARLYADGDAGPVHPLFYDAAAMLRACKSGAVRVKPLTWYGKPDGQDIRIGRCGQISYSVGFKMGRWGYQRRGDTGHTVGYKGGPTFTCEADAIDGADIDHEARILSTLEPAPDQGEWNAAIEAAARAVMNMQGRFPMGTPQANAAHDVAIVRLTEIIRALKKGQTND